MRGLKHVLEITAGGMTFIPLCKIPLLVESVFETNIIDKHACSINIFSFQRVILEGYYMKDSIRCFGDVI